MQDEDKSKEQLITELRELRKRVAELDLVGKRQVRTSATDITERAKQTREIEHLNRLYSVLSRVSQAVVRATSPETFLEQACREIVEAGGFLLAWIGQVELMTNAVVPKAFWGGIGEYVQGITVYADSRPEGLGPTGTCIREHYPVVHNDFLHDPQTLPWHDRAAPFGIASAAAFPIERAGGVWGALTIYSDEVDRFGGEDAKLLEKVADDIEFALDNLDREFRRKQAEEALLESENKFKSFAEQAITGINIIQDGVFKYVNPKCAQMFGYSVEECLNDMPFKNLVYAEDLAEVEEQIRRRTSGETESVHYTFRGLKKNGQIFPMEIYGSAIVYKGRPAATGTILDITERKRAEEALRKSEGKYRQIVETANEGICMADVDYLFTYVNQKMADMLGYLAEEIIGKPLVHFLFPEDLANHQEKRSHRIEGLNETYERRFRRSDGGESWTKVSATVIRTEDGRFMGSFAMLTDITEHKRAEMALRESDVRLKIAMDLARLVQWEYDVKNGMFSFDDQFYALYGTTSQYEGGPMMTAEAYARKFIPPEESHVVTEEIAKTLATNDPNFTNQLEHRIIRADGEERHIIVRYGVICDQTGSIVKIRGANQDITERKNGEKALHESELRLRTILQTVNEGFWLIDNDTVTMDLNPRMCAILGRNPEEVLGRKTFDFVDSEYKAIFEQQIRLRAQGEVGTYEIALSRPDGSNVFCLFNASPLFDGSGNKVGSFAMVTDITERKRAQDELFNSRQMLRSVLDNIPQRVFWKDRNSVFLGCNKPLAMDAGYEDPNELVGKTDYEHASAATADLFRADDREVMESARPKMNYEEPQIRPDGSQAWLITSKVPMYDRDGQVIGVLGTYADITERKLMEEEIRQTNAYLENIFENSPDGIGIVDNHGRFIRWNKMAEDLTGYTFEEMKGKSGFDVYADKGELGKMLMSLRREGSVKKWEMRTVRKDGSIISLEISIALLKDSQNETIGSVCIARDLSSIKETLAALKASHERLYQESADRKRAAEELKDSEQLLKSIIQGYPIPTFMIGKDHRVIHWNRSLEELTGVGASVVIGTSQHWRAFYREERPCMADLLVNENQEAIVRWYGERAGKSEILDEAYKATQFFPDLGETGKWLNFTAAAVRNSKGAIVGVIETLEDVTGREKAEEALRESENRYRAIFENTGTAIIILEEDTTISLANAEFEKLTGYTRDEIENKKSWTEFVVKEDQERMLKLHRLRRADVKAALRQYEFRLIDRHGRTRDCLITVDMIADTKRSIASFLNITERKRAEAALRESEERFSRFFRSTPVGTSITRLSDGQFLDANDAFLGLLGCTREEVIGQESLKLKMWANPEDRAKVIGILQEKGKIKDFETQLVSKSGEIIDVLGSAEVIEMAEEKYMLSLAYDITERKRGEKERKKLEAQLFQAQKMESVGRLAGGVAHDFNNMLGVIIGRAEMALQQDVPTDKLQHNLKEILKAGLRSADLTRQLLAFARKQTAVPKVLDLNDTISDMLSMLRRLIGEDIDLFWVPELDLWKVKIDPSQVDQILANLAVNSRDAISGVGAITMRTENVLIGDSNGETPEFIPGEYVLLTVSDTGAGMSQEVRKNIFEPFFTTKELGKGTGLGLSTVYGIVKQNDGFIYVASEPGKGTTFKIYLPRFDVETAQVPSEEITVRRPAGIETILLVEDDEAILNLSKMILENLGYTVLAAHTPVYALHLVEDHPGDLDLLITDVVMPEMNGRELAEQLRAIRPNLKCLYMSGYTADLIAYRGILDEGINFIQKPFGSDELAARVRQVLDHLE